MTPQFRNFVFFTTTLCLTLIALAPSKSHALPSVCGGVFVFGTSPSTVNAQLDAIVTADPDYTPPFVGSNCSDPSSTHCGIPSSGAIVSQVLCRTEGGDSGVVEANGVILQSSTCPNGEPILPSGECDQSPPDPCPTTQDIYSCTASTYEAAASCAEGAATPQGCELQTTVDPVPPVCTTSGTSQSQGGSGVTYTCHVDLTGTGNNADPGDGLPQTDSDDPLTNDTGNETDETGTDDTGCSYTTNSQTTTTNNGNGTATVCQETTTTRTGGTCPNPGSDVSVNCTTTYADGSSTDTSTNTTTDGGGTVTDSTSSTTNNTPGIPEEGEQDNGQYAGTGDCSAPPTCSGDILQCAIVQEVWESKCKFENDIGDFTEPTIDDPGQLTVDVESEITGFLNTSGWISNRSCPTVPSVSVMGASLDWSFEGICDAYEILSYLILAFAGFSGIRIFMGAF